MSTRTARETRHPAILWALMFFAFAGLAAAAPAASAQAAPVETAQTPEQLLTAGVKAFSQSAYSAALPKFRELTAHAGDTSFVPYAADGYFWLGKTSLALNDLNEAQQNIEYFLMHYPHHPAYPEADYLKARILFLQQDYQQAIQAFQDFIARFPSSPFIASAYYWSAESLYDLGQLDSARKLFIAVVQQYPTSSRAEAAQYRLSLIAQKGREEELLKLLQWSHEESLQAVDDFQQKEKTYQEAILAYQKQLSGQGGNALTEEVTRLSGQIQQLQATISDRDQTIKSLTQKIADLQAQISGTGASTPQASQPATDAQREELLNLRQRATALKQYFQSELNKSQGGPK
ncbi:MAG TPA: tetratricopeptide repeat protein [Spirochaetia bacterium]|nr:tetratricopeptide repeat protein [Spirochaetia bacterium]